MSLITNQYRSAPAINGSTSTGPLLSADFGFDASYVRVENTGTVPLRVTLASTVATTADAELGSGAVMEVHEIQTHVLGLTTTSSSTDTTDFKRALVLALGG